MPMTLLWRRGESAEAAYLRLAAIEPDPAAGRAPRHGMHPCFEGIEDFVPRFIREEMVGLESHGIIVMKQVVLDDVEPGDAVASAAVEDRWVEGSPLRRAALAALAHLTARGVDPSRVHLHGRDVERGVTPYFVGLKLRYLRGMVRCFREFEGVEWLEVVRPTLRGRLVALQIRRGPRFDKAREAGATAGGYFH